MKEILVLAEHRRGALRDVTLDLLARGRELATRTGAELAAVLLGQDVAALAESLARYADRVLVVADETLRVFHSDAYQEALSDLIRQREPTITLIGHTAFGLDLAPSLATAIDASLVTDCIDVDLEDGAFVALRPTYGGKARAQVLFRGPRCIATVQSGSAPSPGERAAAGEIVGVRTVVAGDLAYKQFVEYVDAAAGEVDIAQSEIVVAVGRGIGDPKNLPLVEDLAGALGGVLACSRPVVDKKWLPKARQVGISGKAVQPKLYLAVGISGAFQHVSAIKGAGMIVAINKDSNAPIFRVADFGIVGDLFTVIPALKEKILQARAAT